MRTLAAILFATLAIMAAEGGLVKWDSRPRPPVSSGGKWDSMPPVLDPVEFVRSLELAEPKEKYFKPPRGLLNSTLTPDPPVDDKKQGYVVGGAIAAFTANVKGLSKQDVLDATLFAQLAADRNYDREHDTTNWYDYYKYVLGSIGFVLQSFSFQEYKTSGGTFTMDKVVIEILAAIATGGESLVIQETLNAFRGLAGDDGRIVLFSQQSASSNSGSFQVYPCDQSPTGEVSMAMGAFHFQADHHETRFLFFGWSSASAHIYKGAQSTVLNQNVYARVRSDVSAKLGDNAVNLVASIDLL